jgi:hypothetical protein
MISHVCVLFFFFFVIFFFRFYVYNFKKNAIIEICPWNDKINLFETLKYIFVIDMIVNKVILFLSISTNDWEKDKFNNKIFGKRKKCSFFHRFFSFVCCIWHVLSWCCSYMSNERIEMNEQIFFFFPRSFAGRWTPLFYRLFFGSTQNILY